MNEIFLAVRSLVNHGLKNGLLEPEDSCYTTNLLLERLKLDEYEEPEGADMELEQALKVLLDYASEKGLLGGETTVYRDLFDTALMNCLLPRPSEVIKKFNLLYRESPKAATDFYYAFSRASDYIRTYRVAKDIKWESQTPYGTMIITINLSKPEKDPKAIAAALTMKQSAYPKCQLCRENEGYAGRVNHPARENHRIIPIKINGAPWFLQYSPYVYYNEHCIVFNELHTPMKIDRAAFDKLLDFIRQFPHYCVGSNADLPIVGGSILTHDHFQGGCFEFPMAKAGIDEKVVLKGFEDIEAGIVKWPMTVLRLKSSNSTRIAECAERVLTLWREYGDEQAFIFPYTEKATGKNLVSAPVTYNDHGDEYIPHNTITPIARMRDGMYELDLVLRNNITTDEHPLGVYHPHAEHHHIKKENIGLIEVMGLAILPARLKSELKGVTEMLVNGTAVTGDEALTKHIPWIEDILSRYGREELDTFDKAEAVVKHEVANVYSDILRQCAVFNDSTEGRAAFKQFLAKI